MVRLKTWQWVVLALPAIAVGGTLLAAATWQIHIWGLSWIWAIFILLFVGWRWLLVRWTRPMQQQLDVMREELETLEAATTQIELGSSEEAQACEAALEKILDQSENDPPIWEDWLAFWQRCQDVVVAVAHVYHPEVKYPLLNIYVPQGYALIRGTVDDMDRWMQSLSPMLNQVTVGQAYQAYEVYCKLEPSARKLWRVFNWAQWVLNPAAALARQASQPANEKANQALLANLGQLLRQAALRTLCGQAIALYGGESLPEWQPETPQLPQAKTKTLRDILDKAESSEAVEQKPVNILLVGRTGAGKSSLINTLFRADRAAVDVLPSTDQIRSYRWQAQTGEILTLWDTPGYEQVGRDDLKEQVLDCAIRADLLLVVTPAMDPALQMDADFLQVVQTERADLPTIIVVTQVDRLRPIREWQPPYDWQNGESPKEVSIRQATTYRLEQLNHPVNRAAFPENTSVLPVVSADPSRDRAAWNADSLSLALIDAIAPAKQLRLARFLRDRESRTAAAAQIIDRYTRQMSTTQGLTAMLKSPVLQFLSTLTTGNPGLAYLLAEQIPVEQLPVVIGKLQMAYDLFSLLSDKPLDIADDSTGPKLDLLALWPVLLDNDASPDRNAWAFGHALVEYWSQELSTQQLKQRFQNYLQQAQS